MKKETKSLHTRADISNAHPAMTPIFQNSAFEANSDFFYSRKNNPNVQEFEEAVAVLENTKYGLATTTGMSAITMCLSLIKPGQKVLLNTHIYGCTFKLFQLFAENYQFDLIVQDLTILQTPIPKVDFVFFETPTNPFLYSISIKDVSASFKEKNKDCVIVVDNTWATPLYQHPCEQGADISLHSATKYISGHSDVMGGILLLNDEVLENKLRTYRFLSGSNLDPHSAWLLRRSLMTLEVRVEKQHQTTLAVMDFLKSRNEIEKIYYPSIDQQLTKYPTLVFFDFKSTYIDQYQKFTQSLNIFSTGTGMACVTAMIAQPFTGSHASMENTEKKAMDLTEKTIRLSFGLEAPEDLINDLKFAFEQLN
jgi:cystathionine gamma-lyase/cystathionine gamma-lyase/homocysteine desulfhydrase